MKEEGQSAPRYIVCMSDTQGQKRLILEQFSQQANTFGGVPAHSNAESLDALLELSGVRPTDDVLDLACGPGIVTCALAPRVKSIRGQDLVPAMLVQAQNRANELGLRNVGWDEGDAGALPYADESFDVVVTRFSFHHLLEPLVTLREMARVCKRGGRIVVADVSPTPETNAAYDAFERIRDPSHTHALNEPELLGLFAALSLPVVAKARHGLAMPLDTVLAASFPDPGGAERLRALFQEDLGHNRLGVNAHDENGAIHFYYPVLIVAAAKPR